MIAICYHPIVALRWKRGAPKSREVELISSLESELIQYDCKDFDDLKNKVYNNPAIFGGWLKEVLLINCGQCTECRLQKSREWANRCVLEAQQYPKGTCFFVTLTYSDENLIYGDELPTLDKNAISSFMKRLRRRWQYQFNFPDKDEVGIRFYGAGEYGSKSGRPHYHLILFNIPHLQEDLVFYKTNFQGDVYYNSPLLESCWPYGHVVVADVTWESCAYVARYVMKKRTGPDSQFYEENSLCPEFSLMSRNPGIARGAYDESKIINSEFIFPGKKQANVVQSIEYFDRIFKEAHSDDVIDDFLTGETAWERLHRERKERAEERQKEKTLRTSQSQISELRCKERRKEKSSKKLLRPLD